MAAESTAGMAWEEVWRSPVEGEFGSQSAYDYGVTADLNADGHRDLLAHGNSGGEVRFGRGDGSFGDPVSFADLPIPWLVADLDGDGYDDLVSAAQQKLSVLENSGLSGDVWSGFVARDPVPITQGMSEPPEVVAADWSADGLIDLAVPTTQGVVFYSRDAQGGLSPASDYKLDGAYEWRQLVAGDVDQDGDTDLLASSDSAISLLSNDGKGAFEASKFESNLPSTILDLITGDLDGDGDLDIQLAGRYDIYNEHPVALKGVMLNQADQFWPVGDVNRDGRFDSADLIAVSAAGEYEDRIAGNSTWTDGNWDRDGEFTSSDLVFALQVGTYVV